MYLLILVKISRHWWPILGVDMEKNYPKTNGAPKTGAKRLTCPMDIWLLKFTHSLTVPHCRDYRDPTSRVLSISTIEEVYPKKMWFFAGSAALYKRITLQHTLLPTVIRVMYQILPIKAPCLFTADVFGFTLKIRYKGEEISNVPLHCTNEWYGQCRRLWWKYLMKWILYGASSWWKIKT